MNNPDDLPPSEAIPEGVAASSQGTPAKDISCPSPQEHTEGPEAPPPGVKVMAVVRWAILVAITALAAWTVWKFWGPGARATPVQSQARYYCPMHPQVTSPDPGECPICHMNLEPIPADRTRPTGPMSAAMLAGESTPPDGDAGSSDGVTGSPTHVHASATGNSPASNDGGMHPVLASRADAGTADAGELEGLVPVTLSLERQQRIGVATAVVTERSVGQELRVPGVVEAPEDAVAQVHVRTPGFIERVAVSETAVRVSRGQILAWMYSPEIYRAQQEFLTAGRWAQGQRSNTGPDPGPANSSDTTSAHAMVLAARRSLELLGLADEDIEEIARRGTPMRAIPIRAPRAGYVLRRLAVLGLYAQPDMVLYELADLSRVWVIASVYERDLPRVRRGMQAQFVAAARPGEALQARVERIEPQLDVSTRTARVRLEVSNPGLRLRPGEYGDVLFQLPATSALLVPRDAVIDTGRQQYVFVDRGEGRFEPRRVQLGALLDGQFQVLEGLRAGERVVTRGAFLIDSESRLQAALMETPTSSPSSRASSETGPDCETDFDRQRYPDRYNQCRACERMHRGMGTMEADCKNAIPRPWR